MVFLICMDSPVLTLVIALFFAIVVESQQLSKPPLPQPPESPSPVSPRSPWPPPHSSTPSPLPQPQPRPLPPPLAPPPKKPPTPDLTDGGNHRLNKDLSPSPEKEKANRGKKIGLMFVGVASFLQVCIVVILLISRRHLLTTQNGYQRN